MASEAHQNPLATMQYLLIIIINAYSNNSLCLGCAFIHSQRYSHYTYLSDVYVNIEYCIAPRRMG